jgi:hypothetical protein
MNNCRTIKDSCLSAEAGGVSPNSKKAFYCLKNQILGTTNLRKSMKNINSENSF